MLDCPELPGPIRRKKYLKFPPQGDKKVVEGPLSICCFSNFAGFQTTQTQGYDWNRLNLTDVSERLEGLWKLKDSFELQIASLKEYDKFSLPLERSVIKTIGREGGSTRTNLVEKNLS